MIITSQLNYCCCATSISAQQPILETFTWILLLCEGYGWKRKRKNPTDNRKAQTTLQWT